MPTSAIITLTTDFGLSDPYVGMMKGVILSINPEARIIDVSHQVKAGTITHAAGLIQETCIFFPKGTIHIGVVDPGVATPIAFELKNVSPMVNATGALLMNKAAFDRLSPENREIVRRMARQADLPVMGIEVGNGAQQLRLASTRATGNTDALARGDIQ